MFIHSFVFPKKIFIFVLIITIIISLYFFYKPFSKIFNFNFAKNKTSVTLNSTIDENSVSEPETSSVEDDQINDDKKDFIKWVDFNVTADVLNKTANLDIKSHQNNEDIKYNWIELLAYLACKNGGNFKNFKSTTLDDLVEKLKSGKTIESLTSSMKFYNYYLVLGV